MLPYDRDHEALFYGRERLTAELAGKLAGTAIVMVTGASGAGKTSLLQAGLVPALARGVQVPGSSSWPVVSFSATARPLTDLAAGLASLGGGDPAAIRQMLADAPGEAHLLIREIMLAAGDPARLVLIIDQFEQVFAADTQDGRLERAAFMDAICAAATQPAGLSGEPPARVVIVVRGDYWDRCASYPQLVRPMEDGQLVIGPMPEAGLRRAVSGPAEASGLRVESALIDAIVADVHAADVHAADTGPDGAALPMLSQALALTWENREGDRLLREGYERAGRVARSVEVSAEDVYTGLPGDQQEVARDVFRRMTATDPDRRPVRRPAPRAELRAGHPKNASAQLDAVLDAFARNRLLVLSARTAEIAHDVVLQAWPRLRDWLEEDQASLILYGQLAEDTARWRQDGKDSSLLYRGVQLAAAQEATASLLAGAAWRIAPTAQARYSLLESLAQPVRGTLAAQSGLVTAVAYGPGGTTLAAAYQDGTIRLWDIASHHLISTASWGSAALALVFADGGKTLEVAGPAAVGVWNLTNRATIASRPLASVTAGRSVAFSPDGATLATGGDDGNVRLWNAVTQQEIGAPMSSDLKPVEAVAFSPDGTTVAAASSDGTVQLWNAATQQEAGTTMTAGSAAVQALAFSPGGKFLAAGGNDGNVRLWDVATQGQAGATMATGASVTALSFNAGGTTLATAESDGATELWSFATQEQTGAALTAQGSGSVSALAFSPSASVLATGDGNGTIELWNPAGFHQSSAPIATGTPESPVAAGGHAPAVLSRGGVLAVSDSRGTVRLWNTLTRRPIGSPISSHHAVKGLALSPDGKVLAVAADGLQLWSAATGQRIGGTLPAADAGGPVAFSPDGSLVAAIGADGKARLWKVATQQEIGTPMSAGPGPVYALAFSPDAGTLITAGANGSSSGSARRWDVAFPAGLLTAACAIADQSLTRQQWANYAGTQSFQQVCAASRP